jgi:hypothetical protein
MFTRFFDTRVIDSFAAEVAREMRRSLPPTEVQAEGKQAEKRRAQLDDRLRRMLEQLAAANRLNVYQKAKLGSRLQDEMTVAGYPDEFSRTFSFELVKRLAAIPRR